nr:hypothetical protein [Tanacetum cinerariifolium]
MGESRVQAVSVPPIAEVSTVGIPIGSGMVLAASPIFTTASVVTPYSRRKGKEKMVESDTPKKKKLQEQIDVQVAREMEEQMAREDQRSNEQIARDAEIARIHAEEELQMLIDGLDRNNEGMSLEEIRENFILVWEHIEDFVPMASKEEGERFKRKGLRLEQSSAKKIKTAEDVSKEDLKQMMQLVPVEEVYVEALQGRIVGNKILKSFPLPVKKFPPPEYFPTASEERFPLLSERDAPAEEVCTTDEICISGTTSKTKSWLWHRHLSHLKFGTLDKLAKDGLARGIPRLKFQKDHLCSACALRKSKKFSHQPKAKDTNQEKLCETAQEIWLRVQQMMKGSDIGIQEKKAKLFNEWERFTSNDGESIKSYYHRFLKLINDLKQNKHFSKKIASNLKFLNNLQPEWSRHVTIVHQTKDLNTTDYTQLYDFLKCNQKEVDELKAERLAKTQDPLALMATSNNPYNFLVPHQDQPSFNQNYMQQPMPNPKDITDPTTTMNMSYALMAKAFKLNNLTPTNNNKRILSNLRNRQIAQPRMNIGQDRQMQMVGGNGENQFRQYAGQNVGNLNRNGNLVAVRAEGNATGKNGNQIRCYNCRGVGHFARNCTVRPRRKDVAYLQTQLLIAQKEEAGIQLQAEEFDLMATTADLYEIEEVNENCILMENLQQASTSGTQTDKAPIYDSDGSAEVHNYEDCYDNEIFNMFTQEEQYTELLEPIP